MHRAKEIAFPLLMEDQIGETYLQSLKHYTYIVHNA